MSHHRVFFDPNNRNSLNGTSWDTRSERSKKLGLQWQVQQPPPPQSPPLEVIIEIGVVHPPPPPPPLSLVIIGYDPFGRPIYGYTA